MPTTNPLRRVFCWQNKEQKKWIKPIFDIRPIIEVRDQGRLAVIDLLLKVFAVWLALLVLYVVFFCC